MNASTDNWSNEEDRLLFEYLEGELSEADAKALEARLSVDPSLQSELENWQEAFVEQDFYDTQALEESLLQPRPRLFSFSTFIIVLLTNVLSVLPLVPISESLTPTRPSLEIPLPVAKIDRPAKINEIAKAVSHKKAVSSTPLSEHTVDSVAPQRLVFVEELLLHPNTSSLIVDSLADSQFILADRIKKTPLKKVPVIRYLTRKQQRKIERMKEKARQNRAANQFLKGRVPYVVPLNTNNF